MLGDEAAWEATDAAEVEGFGDEKDASRRYWCTRGGKDFRGMCTHSAKRDEEEG